MNIKQEEYSPVKENLLPFIQEQEQYHDGARYLFPFLTEEMAAFPIITSDHANQKIVNNGNRRTAGTLQQLEVGDSTVEVQGNGSRSFLHIVNSNTNVIKKIENEPNIKAEKKALQERPGYAVNLYFCSHCANGFRTQGSLKSHENACLRRNLQEPVASLQCKECHKILSSVSNLKAHMKMHSGIKPFHCNRCYRNYFDEGTYSAHMDRHKRQDELLAKGRVLSAQHADKQLVVKEFKCLLCKQNFTDVFDVDQVRRRSSCDACRQKYNSVEALPPKQQCGFACNGCGRQFALQGFLQRHQSTCDGTFKRIHRRRFEPFQM